LYFVICLFVLCMVFFFFFFFFQAEDGIRDDLVTGVQTCALPISQSPYQNYGSYIRGYLEPPQTGPYTFWISSDDDAEFRLSTDRSEERRVGKECRSRRSPCNRKKNTERINEMKDEQ